MITIAVDRLTVEAPGLTRDEAERLALLVAERLRVSIPHIDETTNVDALSITVQDDPASGADSLAERIVVAIVREIGRSA